MPAFNPANPRIAGWLDGYNYRAMLCFSVTGATSNQCLNHTIEQTFDKFWDNVAITAGDDVRITKPDGVTELERELDSWDLANKVCNLQTGGYDVGSTPSAGMAFVWLYWGNANATTPGAYAAPQTNIVASRLQLYGTGAADPLIAVPGPNDDAPQWVEMNNSEARPLWADLTGLLAPRVGQVGSEPIVRVDVDHVNVTDDNTSLIESPDGRLLLRALCSPGGSGSGATTATITVYTESGAIYEIEATIVLIP